MPRFIALAKLIDDRPGVAPDVRMRVDLAKELLEKVSAGFVECRWTAGAYDLVVIFDLDRDDGANSEAANAYELMLRAALPANVVTLTALEHAVVADQITTAAPVVEQARPATGREGAPRDALDSEARPATGRPATGRPATGRGAAGREET